MTTRMLGPDDVEYYPASDGLPMGETPLHIDNLAYLVEMFRAWYHGNNRVLVAGDMFVYYERGNRKKHVSPDVFVSLDVPRVTTPARQRYLVWQEGKAPNVVIELTSKSTRREDQTTKRDLYRDVLKVREYFLFDPHGEYLDPPLQGYSLVRGRYEPIAPVDGRLPSAVLGLLLEGHEGFLRPTDPNTGQWLPLPPEERLLRLQAEAALDQARQGQRDAEVRWQLLEEARSQEERARQEAEAARAAEEFARRQAEAEVARLRQELEALRQRPPEPPDPEG